MIANLLKAYQPHWAPKEYLAQARVDADAMRRNHSSKMAEHFQTIMLFYHAPEYSTGRASAIV
jgi:hypothetical protein